MYLKKQIHKFHSRDLEFIFVEDWNGIFVSIITVLEVFNDIMIPIFVTKVWIITNFKAYKHKADLFTSCDVVNAMWVSFLYDTCLSRLYWISG